MNRILILLAVLGLVLFAAVQPVTAAELPPSTCPVGFHPHDIDHLHEGMHRHVGVRADDNVNGIVCVKHLTDTIHLVVDDYIP
jgi:hypothetical protein